MPPMPVASLLKFVMGRHPQVHAVPAGTRVYAVGDIHGRRDLFDILIARIQEDNAQRAPADCQFILLGDLIDRGEESRGVVERAIQLARSELNTRFLMGNHEEVFIRAARGDKRALRLLLRIGGRETLLSYGISPDEYKNLDFDDLAALFMSKVPSEHVDFLSSFENCIEIGDYLFVHAGVRPGVSLAEQSPADMRWIRDEFLRYRDTHGRLVVHGHSVSEDIDIRPNRIGIDTGAYTTGRLTAIGLEGSERWFLST